MFEHFDTPRAPLQFAPEPSWPGLTPYERALDDLAGNDGTLVTNAAYAIAEKVENDFNDDFVQTSIGLEAARNAFEELVEKAREAFDSYERKLEDIEERRKHGVL